jgi:hypothetical protein
MSAEVIPPPPTGLAGLQAFLAEAKLPVPPCPTDLAAGLRPLSATVFSTRTDAPSVYDAESYLAELQTTAVPDYLAVGIAGHGLHSWALHYYLVHGPVALFLQRAWGGANMEESPGRRQITGAFALADRLLAAAQTAQAKPSWPSGQTLVVFDVDFGQSRWAWVKRGAGLAPPTAWQHQVRCLPDALLAVQELLK